MEKQPEVKRQLEEVAETPEAPSAEAVLSWQLRKVFATLLSEELGEVQRILGKTKSETKTITALGDRSVAIEDGAQDAQLNSGDRIEFGSKGDGVSGELRLTVWI